MIVNPRIAIVKESATLAINQTAKKLRTEGEVVYHFGFGESPFPVHSSVSNSLKERSGEKSYLPCLGLPELRECVAGFLNRFYSYKTSAKNVVIGPGSKELLFQILYLVEGTVLIPAPSWVSYKPQANLLGKNCSYVTTSFENHFKLTATGLSQAVKNNPDKQYILILNSPSNPTGQAYQEDELEVLAEICEQHNIYVISDEIYSQLYFSGSFPSIANYIPDRVFVTNGMSKALCAGGYRLGFVHLPEGSEELIKAFTCLISETFSCVSSPIQYAALKAFQMEDDLLEYTKDTSKILKAVLDFSQREYCRMGIDCHESLGGFYLFPGFNQFREKLAGHDIHISEQLAKALLGRKRITFLPGSDFGMESEMLFLRASMTDFDGGKIYEEYKKYPSKVLDNISDYIPNVKKGLVELSDFLNEI